MTAQENKALAFIISFIAEHEISPKMQEISDHLGLKSKSGAHRIVDQLERKRKITRHRNCARSIEIVQDAIGNWLADVPTHLLQAELARREVAI